MSAGTTGAAGGGDDMAAACGEDADADRERVLIVRGREGFIN
jgi:hypothetical protein